jgi:hypothetical protein
VAGDRRTPDCATPAEATASGGADLREPLWRTSNRLRFRFRLRNYVTSAAKRAPTLSQKRVTPHLFRHYAGFRTIPGEVSFEPAGSGLA